MKFEVRDGFVVRVIRRIDLGNDKFQDQEITAYGGQVIDLTADEANDHGHKLAPLDKAATALLEAKVRPADTGTEVDMSPAQMALIQAVALATAQAVTAHLQATAQPAADQKPAGA